MTTAIALIVVAALIAAFSYYTNAGFGDRRPREPKKKDQASAGAADEPPPHK